MPPAGADPRRARPAREAVAEHGLTSRRGPVEEDEPTEDGDDDAESLPRRALGLRRGAEPAALDDLAVHGRLDALEGGREMVLQLRQGHDVTAAGEDAVQQEPLVGQQLLVLSGGASRVRVQSVPLEHAALGLLDAQEAAHREVDDRGGDVDGLAVSSTTVPTMPGWTPLGGWNCTATTCWPPRTVGCVAVAVPADDPLRGPTRTRARAPASRRRSARRVHASTPRCP